MTNHLPDQLSHALDALLATDAYKLGHSEQYPPGTEVVFSNLTARASRIPSLDTTVFFGLQAVLAEIDAAWRPFFALSPANLDEVLDAYRAFVGTLIGPDAPVNLDKFRQLHAVGHLPIRVRAFREGSLVPIKVPYLTIENTDPSAYWLTNYLETALSAGLWQPITTATLAWRARRLLDAKATLSGDRRAVLAQGHDFSFRGMAGMEAAAASGAAHLTSFTGTDTLPAVRFVDHYYPGSPDTELIGGSCAATEHSVMCADGADGEFGVYARLLDTYPTGTLALVSDSYDLWRVLTDYLPRLHEKVVSRAGRLVIRPDSGDPLKILLGDPAAPAGSPAERGVVALLADEFGTTTNKMGFKELNEHVGVVYGDSITYDRAHAITTELIRQGFASTTVTLGFGSFTYQYQTRDTFGMAVKATWMRRDGVGHDVFKDPATDDGTKRSARGRLAVRSMADGTPYLIEHPTEEQERNQLLETVYADGEFVRTQSFSDVRKTLETCTGVFSRREWMARPGALLPCAGKCIRASEVMAVGQYDPVAYRDRMCLVHGAAAMSGAGR